MDAKQAQPGANQAPVLRRDRAGHIYPAINWSNAAPALVTEMLAGEQKMLSEGHASYHAIIVAMPKPRLARWYAVARYFVAPKLRRIRLEILTRLQPEKKIRF